jgi:hypothetical protein
MNELVLHRGREPHLIKIDCYVNDQLLTNAFVSTCMRVSRRSLHNDARLGRRTDCCYADGVNGVLAVGRRPYCASLALQHTSDACLSQIALVQTDSVRCHRHRQARGQ